MDPSKRDFGQAQEIALGTAYCLWVAPNLFMLFFCVFSYFRAQLSQKIRLRSRNFLSLTGPNSLRHRLRYHSRGGAICPQEQGSLTECNAGSNQHSGIMLSARRSIIDL